MKRDKWKSACGPRFPVNVNWGGASEKAHTKQHRNETHAQILYAVSRNKFEKEVEKN